jgi:peptidoglycan/xylan/chitin deacetylase (PgdA/CDA1 family)
MGRKPKVALTFDDGYSDNLLNALPLLSHHGIPATVFVISSAVGRQEEFWWDQLESILLTPGELPQELEIEIEDGNFYRLLSSERSYSIQDSKNDRGMEVFKAEPGTRIHLFREVWELLCFMPDQQRRETLRELWDWSGKLPIFRDTCRPLKLDELRELAKSPLIEIGAHTMTHNRLPTLPLEEMRLEINQSKQFLEDTLETRVKSFSYPFGQFDERAIKLVMEAGLKQAVTTKSGRLDNTVSRYQLPRIPIANWGTKAFGKVLEI